VKKIFHHLTSTSCLMVFNSTHRIADLAVLRWGYKRSRELARRMGLYRGELSTRHPTFNENSGAFCKETTPAGVTDPDIVYTVEDDKAIDAHHRKFGTSRYPKELQHQTDLNFIVQTAWHSVGFAVCDSSLSFVTEAIIDRNVCNEAAGPGRSC
jgi:hypothetical protein